jgi:hypothetical protein
MKKCRHFRCRTSLIKATGKARIPREIYRLTYGLNVLGSGELDEGRLRRTPHVQAIDASGGHAVILRDGLATGGGTWNPERVLQRSDGIAGEHCYCGKEMRRKLQQGPIDYEIDYKCKVYSNGKVSADCENWRDFQNAKSKQGRNRPAQTVLTTVCGFLGS